ERAAHPFVVIACGDFSDSLMEAELLGVDCGTPPHKIGIFEQAGAGTVLLAEVDELPARLQEAMVHLLERHELKRLNSTTPVPARARVIASSCVDLRARISAGLFREDLYRRLSAEKLELPPLRDRADDIRALARHPAPSLPHPRHQPLVAVAPAPQVRAAAAHRAARAVTRLPRPSPRSRSFAVDSARALRILDSVRCGSEPSRWWAPRESPVSSSWPRS